MSNTSNTNSRKQKRGAQNAKLLIAAASITITLGGAAGLLGEQLATPAPTSTEQADVSAISITYLTPSAVPTATPDASVASAPSATEIPQATAKATAAAELAATTEPTVEPTAVPTIEPTAVPTAEPTATQVVVQSQRPVIVARTRSSR